LLDVGVNVSLVATICGRHRSRLGAPIILTLGSDGHISKRLLALVTVIAVTNGRWSAYDLLGHLLVIGRLLPVTLQGRQREFVGPDTSFFVPGSPPGDVKHLCSRRPVTATLAGAANAFVLGARNNFCGVTGRSSPLACWWCQL